MAEWFGNSTQNNSFAFGSATVSMYGQTFIADGDFDAISPQLLLSTTGAKTFTLELYSGIEMNSPMLESHTQDATVTGWRRVELNQKYPPGQYHFRLSSTNPNLSVYRNSVSTSYPDGNAVAIVNGSWVTSSYDCTFLVWYYVRPHIGTVTSNAYNGGPTTSGGWVGQKYTAPWAFNELQVFLRGNGFNDQVSLQIREGATATSPIRATSTAIKLPAPGNSSTDPGLWYGFTFPTLPPGEYHWRVYKDSGSPRHYYLSSAGGGTAVNSLRGDTASTMTVGSFDYTYRVLQDESVVETTGTRKRWTGTEWVDAVTKRWSGAAWIIATIDRVVFPERRYWDVEQYSAAIDSASDIATMASVPNEMETAYGVDLTTFVSTVTRSDFISDPAPIDAPETKPAYKVFVDQLAKYPANFILSATGITRMVMSYNLRKTDGTTFGGVAFDAENEAWVNIVDDNVSAYGGTVFRNVEFVFHHELMHLINHSWSSDLLTLQDQWVALNPEPYRSDAESALPMGRPVAHIRRYGRTNFGEDIADVFAAMFTTSMQSDLEQWISFDTALAGKVQLLKNFLESKDTQFANPHYFRAIHS